MELTRLYGRSEFDMSKLYRSLRGKAFPHLGQSIQLKVKIKGKAALTLAAFSCKIANSFVIYIFFGLEPML